MYPWYLDIYTRVKRLSKKIQFESAPATHSFNSLLFYLF